MNENSDDLVNSFELENWIDCEKPLVELNFCVSEKMSDLLKKEVCVNLFESLNWDDFENWIDWENLLVKLKTADLVNFSELLNWVDFEK